MVTLRVTQPDGGTVTPASRFLGLLVLVQSLSQSTLADESGYVLPKPAQILVSKEIPHRHRADPEPQGRGCLPSPLGRLET